MTPLRYPEWACHTHSAESDILVATPVTDQLAGHHHGSEHHSCGKVFQVDVLSACAEHMPLPSAGGTMNVSGGETLLQTRVPTFLNQHGFSQSMHYIADAQEKPTTDGTFVSEEVLKLKESASANSTDAASMIMKARDMLLELYRARVEQR